MKTTLFTAFFFAFFALATLVTSIITFCNGNIIDGILSLIVCAIDIFDSVVCFMAWHEERKDCNYECE